MQALPAPLARLLCLQLLPLSAAFLVLGACGTKETIRDQVFRPDAPFSKTIQGSGDVVCWSVKRAFLSQGYMLERSNDYVILTGTRDFQPEDEVNVTFRLQTTCVDNHDGTSSIFATATQEVSKLQSLKQSTTAGIGPAMITLPSGSARVLGVVRRETVQDANFYQRFFNLVQGYAAEGSRNNLPQRRDERTDLRKDNDIRKDNDVRRNNEARTDNEEGSSR